jgi:hypothetical protein
MTILFVILSVILGLIGVMMLYGVILMITELWVGGPGEDQARGSTSLCDPSWDGKFLLMFFEYHSGGGCKLAAVYEADFNRADLSRMMDVVVFVMDELGRVTDFHVGPHSFCAPNDEDWHAMRKDVQHLWQEIRDSQEGV